MKLSLKLIVLFLILPFFGRGQEQADALVWKPNVLSWDYFTKVETIGNGHSLARIHWKLHVVTDDTITVREDRRGVLVKIYALMIPSLSFVKAYGSRQGVLEHEQIHFDNVEVAARRLRKQLLEKGIAEKNYQRKISLLTRSFVTKITKAQVSYDEHHRGKEKGHNWWRTTIDKDLEELGGYSNVVIFVPFTNVGNVRM